MSSEVAHSFGRDRPAPPPGTRGMVRHRAGIAVVLLVLLAGGLAGARWVRDRLAHVEDNDAQVVGEITTVASRVDGWLIVRPVMEGDRVRKGQVLAELDARDARFRLAALEAQKAATEAQIRQTTIQRDTTQQTAEAQIADARAQVAAADAAVEVATHVAAIARSDFARADPLVGRGDVSRHDWDHARSTLLQGEAALRLAQGQKVSRQAALTLAIAQLGQVPVLAQQIEVLRAQHDGLAAQADQVRQEIGDRSLRAPFDAIIDRTFIHPGDYVQTGQWLMMLHDPDDVWVEANIKETEVSRVRVGAGVAISVDAWSGVALHGRVLRVGTAATNQFALLPSPNPSGNFTKITQRVPVRIAIDKPEHPLQPGLMVEVSIDVAD
jgi:membrane fusion protein (multidrug efflux system)